MAAVHGVMPLASAGNDVPVGIHDFGCECTHERACVCACVRSGVSTALAAGTWCVDTCVHMRVCTYIRFPTVLHVVACDFDRVGPDGENLLLFSTEEAQAVQSKLERGRHSNEGTAFWLQVAHPLCTHS